MNPKPIKNPAHSVNARLKNLAFQAGAVDFDYYFLKYAFERFLYRLSLSPHAENFVLKGSAVFSVWMGPLFRMTRDTDLACRGPCDAEFLKRAFHEICRQECLEDGILFDMNSMEIEEIKKEDKYKGLRVVLRARIDQAQCRLQFDVGFGDFIFPPPEICEYPVLLGGAAPKLRIYPCYTVVAEKFEAMVSLGMTNSRIKDYYDIWLLTEKFDFDSALLRTAIEKTFERHGVALPQSLPVGLTLGYAKDEIHVSQWKSFLKKVMPPLAPNSLTDAVTRIVDLLQPIIETQGAARWKWYAGRGWCQYEF